MDIQRKLKEKIKSKSAITLIALIITIIILLILAGVVINLSLSNSGIFTRANEAKFKTQISKYKEEVDLYVINKTWDKYSEEVFSINAGETLKEMIQQEEITDIELTDVNLTMEEIIDGIKKVKQNIW